MDPAESSKPPTKALIGLVVIVLLVIAATAAVVALNSAGDNANDASQTASDQPATTENSPSATVGSGDTASSSAVKDGTYDATGSYQTPGGTESIEVKISLADGVITNASITEQGKTGEAQEFQSRFASGYKSQVVGKKISDVELTRVAGSSLTPIGFNNALDEIEKQAQA